MLQKNKLSKKSLFDTSALIALLKQESGYEVLENLIANSAVSAINLSELVSVLIRKGILSEEVDEIVNDVVPEIIPFTKDIAITAGKLIKVTTSFGLSLGDRACIATGIHYGMQIYTTDKAWANLDLDNATIHLVR